MDLRALVFRDYPNLIFISVLFVTSFLALSSTPSPIPIILTLTGLLLYSRIIFPSPYAARYTPVLWFAIGVAGTLARVAASLDALSTPTFSIIALFSLSAINSFLTLGVVYVDTKVCTRLPSPWAQITLFPALWTSLWFGISYLSPLGRLSVWSPVEGTGSYDWIIQAVGAPGIDWIVAAWAVVFAQAIGEWFIGSDNYEAPLIAQPKPQQLSHMRSSSLLAALLSALAAFSTFVHNYPLAPLSDSTTPFSVGCILPQVHQRGLTLEDFIKESNKWKSSARILLWPEGALTFNSEAERNEGLAKVQQEVRGTAYIGVSFEEVYKNNGSQKSISKHTGLAIVSQWSTEPHLVYYKRHLVPGT